MTESTSYEVLETFDGVEIRRYSTIILAKVSGLSDDMAFRILFRYITGENKVRQDIAMTVPVISTGPTYQRIAMTRPVLSDEESFSFVVPSFYSITTVPQPVDERVRMVEVKPRKLAVLRFSGRMHQEAIEAKEAELLRAVSGRGLKTRGGAFLMRYNGPGTPGFLRRNEVAIEIDG
jgi:hypothetical protein